MLVSVGVLLLLLFMLLLIAIIIITASTSWKVVDGVYGGSAVCLFKSKYPRADGLPHIHVSARLYLRRSECAAAVACLGHACAILSPSAILEGAGPECEASPGQGQSSPRVLAI